MNESQDVGTLEDGIAELEAKVADLEDDLQTAKKELANREEECERYRDALDEIHHEATQALK